MKNIILLVVAASLAFIYPVAAQSITIQGTVNDANGATATFGPVTVTIDAVTITSASVSPQVAPAGTLRTLTVVATSSAGAVLSAPLPTGTGLTFTAVTGQPAGTFKWTFTY